MNAGLGAYLKRTIKRISSRIIHTQNLFSQSKSQQQFAKISGLNIQPVGYNQDGSLDVTTTSILLYSYISNSLAA